MPEAHTTTPAGITYRWHVGSLAECSDSYCPEPHASKAELLDFGEGMDCEPSPLLPLRQPPQRAAVLVPTPTPL